MGVDARKAVLQIAEQKVVIDLFWMIFKIA